MRILAIETSCDETALALVEASGGLRAPKFKILQNIVSSQIEIHRPWGGVVPNLAKREHIKNLPIVYRQILENPKSEILSLREMSRRDIISKQSQNSKSINHKTPALIPNSYLLAPDVIAVTVGPGLEPALWAGIEFAKTVHQQLTTDNKRRKIPLLGVNHLEGHLYSFLLSQKTGNPKPQTLNPKRLFPAVALIISGGHTILLKMDSLTKWKKLGETRDDAVGEAFDKVARIIGLPYPGGPEIQKAAECGNPAAINFPRPMIHSKEYDFSFSGLKTAVLYYVRDHIVQRTSASSPRKSAFVADVAASFQEAATDVLAAKTERAVREFRAKSILLSGGVAANAAIRHRLSVVGRQLSVNFLVPPVHFNTDNATMIAAAAYIQYLRKKNRRLVANGTLNL